MELSISYLPKHYYSYQPDLGGFFPFGYKGTPLYTFILESYILSSNKYFIPKIMENIKAYPIYFCAEIPSHWKERYERICHIEKITYEYIENHEKFVITNVKNESQLFALLPFFFSIGSINHLVLWSTNKNVFSVEICKWIGTWEGNKEAVVVEFTEETNVFWIGYDGDYIVGLSNNTQFSTYNNICTVLPDFVKPSEDELE